MLSSTFSRLKCPRCKKAPGAFLSGAASEVKEIRSGSLTCTGCQAQYPILAGVAILVEEVHEYLLAHVKGISKLVPDAEIHPEILPDYLDAKAELQSEHIEEDLEAERVNALYLMNHYLRVSGGAEADWWKPRGSAGSPLIDELVRNYWDHGPFAQIGKWVSELFPQGGAHAVELGCGVGGLHSVIAPFAASYLGVDSSFASVALGRHLVLGVPYRGELRIPGDLLEGGVSREVRIPVPDSFDGRADLVVGDFVNPPVQEGHWDLTLALNAIDMMDEPRELPELQYRLLKNEGIAVSSCPYIWHEEVARALRAKLPGGIRDSAQAAEWLYRESGFEITERVEHLPWLFLKHLRQLEIYSVHLFTARKRG
ncbi:MAG: methyltransferase domain-containing protein [Bdellovibrionota bacterium]